MKGKINKPYPVIKVCNKNIEYGRMMLDNVGGICSEMSAIALYQYNHIISKKKCKELSKMFEEISICEMHHLEMFLELAFDLGMDPRLWSCSNDYNEYWSPSYNNYQGRLITLLENSIDGDSKAIIKYSHQRDIIDDHYIKAILDRIIEDEQLHLLYFEGQYNKLVKN